LVSLIKYRLTDIQITTLQPQTCYVLYCVHIDSSVSNDLSFAYINPNTNPICDCDHILLCAVTVLKSL